MITVMKGWWAFIKHRSGSVLIGIGVFLFIGFIIQISANSVAKVISNQERIAENQQKNSKQLLEQGKLSIKQADLALAVSKQVQCNTNVLLGGVPKVEQDKCRQQAIGLGAQTDGFIEQRTIFETQQAEFEQSNNNNGNGGNNGNNGNGPPQRIIDKLRDLLRNNIPF